MARYLRKGTERLPCTRCGELKSVLEFPIDKGRRPWRIANWCIVCRQFTSYGLEGAQNHPQRTWQKEDTQERSVPKVLPLSPPAPPRPALPVLKTDTFRCEYYRCTLSYGACLQRQRAYVVQRIDGEPIPNFVFCATKCLHGQQNLELFGEKKLPAVRKVDAFGRRQGGR